MQSDKLPYTWLNGLPKAVVSFALSVADLLSFWVSKNSSQNGLVLSSFLGTESLARVQRSPVYSEMS